MGLTADDILPAAQPATCADGSMTVDEAIAGVLELFPGAGKQALQRLAQLLTKPPAAQPVAWRYRCHAEDKWEFDSEPGRRWSADLCPHFECEPLYPTQPANDDALIYATSLARSLHSKHCPEVTQWRPLPDMLGVLTQIDNMVAGLTRADAQKAAPPAAQPAQVKRVRNAADRVDQLIEAIEFGETLGDLYVADLRNIATTLRSAALAAQVEPAPAQPALPDGMRSVPCAVQLDPLHPQHGWLFIPHVDGRWVSAFKLVPFSQKIVEYWLAARPPAAQEQR